MGFFGIDRDKLSGSCMVVVVVAMGMVIKHIFRVIYQFFRCIYDIIRDNMFSAIEFIVIYLHCFMIYRSIQL